jgi:hypothetical protein
MFPVYNTKIVVWVISVPKRCKELHNRSIVKAPGEVSKRLRKDLRFPLFPTNP